MRGRRALSRCACVALLAISAGCTAASSSQTVTGKTLYIYVSAPASAQTNAEQQDVLNAEKLAFNQLQGSVSSFKLSLVPVGSPNVKPSDNARTAISNTSTIAYLGEVAPGSSADSIGITNAQDVLQVSPTDTAAELTQPTSAVKGAPQCYYESLSTYNRTFARVVPTTAIEAQAVVKEMQALRVKNLYVTGDATQSARCTAASGYARTLVQEVEADAAQQSIHVQQSATGADAVFYAGAPAAGAASALAQAAQTDPKAKLFVPSALDDPTFVSGLQPAVQRSLLVSAPGFLPGTLSTAGHKFVADFKKTYGHVPAGQAIFGYAAMQALIAVIQQSGSSANNRSAVVHKFLALSNYASVLGPLSINGSGDANVTGFVFNRVKAGKLVPFKAAKAT